MLCGGPPGVRAACPGFLCWLGLRLWSHRATVLVLLLWLGSWLVLNGLVLVHQNNLSDFCTDHKSKKILEQLCADFSEGLVSGDMCPDLCLLRQVQYRRCLYYESGKKVMEARWRGRPVVLKSKLENFSSYEPLAVLDYQDGAQDLSPVDVLFYATLEVRNSLGLHSSLEESPGNWSSLARLWGAEPKTRERKYSRAELASLWALLQQEEYTFLRVLQDLSVHVPQVLGSCGHFYAVELLSAGHAWDQNLFSLEEAGGQRGRWSIALSFLHMVAHFDRDFAHQLHLCDVKPENFAVRSDLTVVAIDVDMAFFQPKMADLLEQNCSSDDDCDFFDCSSRCDAATRHCGAARRNSNLQVVCEKIFRPWFSPTLLGAKAARPLQVELQRAVQECSKQGGGAGGDVHRRLLHILTHLLEEGG